MQGSPSKLSKDNMIVGAILDYDEPQKGSFPSIEGNNKTSRFLITLDKGIGDALLVGLSAVDQIVINDPTACGKIDILCTPLQAQIFACDPRINLVIQTDKVFASGPKVTEWLRGIYFDSESSQVIHSLQSRCYEAVLPTIVAPGLYMRLHAHLMYPHVFKLAKNLLLQGVPSNIPVRKFIRQMVNTYFCKAIPASELHDDILLYLDTQNVQRAKMVIEHTKQQSSIGTENVRLLLVAADSGSIVTRPPTNLLAPALAQELQMYPDLIVGILPGYTDVMAARNLELALLPAFAGRIFQIHQESIPTLLDTAALIDQADIFVTGDTGVMHLASATKKVIQGETSVYVPKNSVKIIALFGGTNPDIWGDNVRTIILGRGRKEQQSFSPGFVKEMYNPKGKDLFDHISPQELAETIASQL
jgi:Glycosyltransferase family 9 (heptosyltransferase)